MNESTEMPAGESLAVAVRAFNEALRPAVERARSRMAEISAEINRAAVLQRERNAAYIKGRRDLAAEIRQSERRNGPSRP